MKTAKQKGYSLAEVLITVVILGVLAALVIPNYRGTVERARENEARTNLQIIYMGEKVYALNHSGVYWASGANPTLASINSTLGIDITAQFYDIVSITVGTGTFTATATRNTVSGGNGTKTFTINQAGMITNTAN